MADKGFSFGKGIFNQEKLCRMAAERKGLKLREGGSKTVSEPLASIELSAVVLRKLDELGIKRHERPDDVFTLADTNPQVHTPGWTDSNYWNFKPIDLEKGPVSSEMIRRNLKYDLRVDLSVELRVNQRERGVVFVPQASGTFLSPSDPLPNFRMFKALVEIVGEMPYVAREIASDGSIVVTWTDLGLGGLRSIMELYREFSNGKPALEELARRDGIFDPSPFPAPNSQVSTFRYIAETEQPRLFRRWKEELDEYRAKLAL